MLRYGALPFLLLSLFSVSLGAVADSSPSAQIDLPVLIREGTPGDLLMEDAVVPGWSGETDAASSSGTLQKSLSDQIALPIISTAAPGSNVQLRGLGRSAEDTDVQAFGIPLNPPQGGGFDLSIFPQFIWSSYEFQAGPALGTFDPRGTAGSLTLTPWTEQALGAGSAAQARGMALGSTANVFQVAVAASDGKHIAVVAGTSAGDVQGPSAALSTQWAASARTRVSFHLLITDLDARSPGPAGLTPFAHQQTVRGIPLLQLDAKLGSEAVLKTSVFMDSQYLRYDDPASSAVPATQDHSTQIGTENALLWGNWKFGAGLRGVQYHTIGFSDQSEAVVDLLISRTFEPWGGWILEPTVRAVGVSAYGVVPEASLGGRLPLGDRSSVYARVGLSRHFPSMVNRFYSYPGFPGYPGFVGNPALQPEEDWTGTLGWDWKGDRLQAGIQGYGQFAQDAQVRAPLNANNDTELNLGNARTASLLGHVQWAPLSVLDWGLSATLSASQLSSTGQAFVGQPAGLAVFFVGVHPAAELAGGGHRWDLRAFERVSSTALANTLGVRLPAYHEEDLEFRARIRDGWTAIARVDDLSNQQPQLVLGYPSYGRAGSLMVSGSIY